jgi:hypothetical protein
LLEASVGFDVTLAEGGLSHLFHDIAISGKQLLSVLAENKWYFMCTEQDDLFCN